jgi:hypothetical protein
MPKRAISLTLAEENLVWLRGQARNAGRRSVSGIVDRLLTEARRGGRVLDDSIRSVVGTISIAPADPGLVGADAEIAPFPRPTNERGVRGGGADAGDAVPASAPW